MKPNPAWPVLTASILAGAFLSSPTSAAIRQPQETSGHVVERVKKANKNEEWDRAQSGITHALRLKPDSAEAHFLAAQVYMLEGARSMALESVTRAIETQPVYAEAHLLLARCLVEAGKPEKSREEVNIALAQGISLLPAYRLLAEIDLATGDFSAAIASLETALRYASEDTEDAAGLRERIEQSREFAEKLKRFALLEADQKDMVRPRLLNFEHPVHTEEARRLKIQGTVLMGLLVTETGEVASVLLLRGPGHGLDEQAMEVARKLKFSPATRGGQPTTYWTKLNIEFNLR